MPDLEPDETVLKELMAETVEEARRCVSEDGAAHPKVAAMLVDPVSGNELLRAFRGELGMGEHAEYTLFRKAHREGVDTRGKLLLTTLEPCVQRGAGKTPCAERVAASGVTTVYIGTLDPNPEILGHGEMELSYVEPEIKVGRYPLSLANELRSMNQRFFDQFRDQHKRTGIIPSKFHVANASKSRDRNRLLQSTLDLIAAGRGGVRIRGGGLSWVREAYMDLLLAAATGRSIEVVCTRPEDPHKIKEFEAAQRGLSAIGAVVFELAAQSLKFTVVDLVGPADLGAIAVDRGSSQLLLKPSDEGLIALINDCFEGLKANSSLISSRSDDFKISWTKVETSALINALRSGVPQYQQAEISVEQVDVDVQSVLFLSTQLETFKDRRLRTTEMVRAHFASDLASGEAAYVTGSDWPLTPPVLECRDGKFVVVDGSHRVNLALQHNSDTSIRAIVVRNVAQDLPAATVEPNGVAMYLTKAPREVRYLDYKPESFRPIRSAFSAVCRSAQ